MGRQPESSGLPEKKNYLNLRGKGGGRGVFSTGRFRCHLFIGKEGIKREQQMGRLSPFILVKKREKKEPSGGMEISLRGES